MRKLHIVQGDLVNDKAWLDKAAKRHLSAPTWIAPKSVAIGDDAVIYVGNHGFYATARFDSLSTPREDWKNRYGARLSLIKLIQPSISIGTIRQQIPALTWANYPRSITTPSIEIANQIRRLIRDCRKTGIPDFTDESLEAANKDQLRTAALLKARPSATPKERKTIFRVRSNAIRLYVLCRANGVCEGCNEPAPFCKPDGSHYLEPHHTMRLSDDGPDHPAKVIGLCPNCHRKAHHAENSEAFNAMLIKKLRKLEPK